MSTIVVKFGGSSLANATQILKSIAIIKADKHRRYVVVSAPGKAHAEDTKVTDLLYRCYNRAVQGGEVESVLSVIEKRFAEIISGLNIDLDLSEDFKILRDHLASDPSEDFVASRGEYLNAKVLSACLGCPMLDAADYICFDENGKYDQEATEKKLIPAIKSNKNGVFPGFYGATPDGKVHTFSRGGSDITGAIVAKAAGAYVYENWTDVSGMLVADPRIVENPKPIENITYRELRELSYMGAAVLHEDAVFPVRQAGIPINIRNTNAPDDDGTMILHHLPDGYKPKSITGIAGNHQFSVVRIEKAMMNNEIGFGAKVLQIFSDFNLSFEHMPSGIDTLSVVVATDKLTPVKTALMERLQKETMPDVIYAEDDMAIIAVVGHGMVSTKGTAARVLSAIAKADINIRMIDQGSGELNIIVGVHEKDYTKAIVSLYKEFEKDL
ncbi:MAG: aspartate kinase [Clostridia bacterium]|nr:aspartate kinase [Clostridia bacterium]